MPCEIYLAIDLKDGRAVRLAPHGAIDKPWTDCGDPVEIAENAENGGLTWLHVVDLDGAAGKLSLNFNVIADIIQRTELKVQVSGGLRSIEGIENVFNIGARCVVIGTAAVKTPELVTEAAKRWPGRVGVCLDSKNGKICVDAWKTVTDQDTIPFARKMAAAGAAFLVYTDIGRDGTRTGLNVTAAQGLANIVHIPVIVSGGAKNRGELMKLRTNKSLGIAGAIAGSAFYTPA